MIKTTFPSSENQSAEYRTVVDFYKAIFQLDGAKLLRLIADDCTYVVHGNVSYEGKSGLTKMLNDIKQNRLGHVRIDNIIANKKHAAINGIVVLKDDSRFVKEFSQLSFAEFLTFSPEQKIQRVDAYPVVASGQEIDSSVAGRE